jgi:hypothetical protein
MLTVLELPNLFALLDLVQRAGDAEATIGLATSLYSLLSRLGKPRLLERVGQVRDAAAAALGDAWNHARFQAARTRIQQQLGGGRLREAFDGAQQLLQRARQADEQAYPDADYDQAGACWLLARVLQTAGGSEQALPLLDEARQRFEAIVAVSLRETDAGNPAAAAEAKGKAIACYLAYRRDGGENHSDSGRIALAVTQSLLAGAPAQAASLFQQLAADPDAAWLLTFIRTLQAIVAGRRDRTLADAPDLSPMMAAEILFLIETLEKSR